MPHAGAGHLPAVYGKSVNKSMYMRSVAAGPIMQRTTCHRAHVRYRIDKYYGCAPTYLKLPRSNTIQHTWRYGDFVSQRSDGKL